jgi:diguanylate cyclase (GGDEF)-like protein
MRLLVIEPGALPGNWDFPGYTSTLRATAEAGRAAMLEHGWDCVVISASQELPDQRATALLRQCCEETEVAFVLAAEGSTHGLAAAMDAECFDGLLDTNWPADLRLAALESAIRRFQLGPNVVGMQRVALDAARQEVRSLEEMVFRDELTQLYNLRYFREVLRKEHARCERHGRPYALIYLDLDELKGINTRYGHDAGSQVLARFGGILQESIRACDYAFRVGGDEFTLLIVESTGVEALAFAERVTSAVRAADILVGSVHLRMTASVGVASFPADGLGSGQVLECSDRAVSHAKSAGRDRVVCYAEGMR